jgi:hypothetical protein
MNVKLTPAEIRILRYYKSIGKVDRERGGGLRFCRSLKTIAAETGCTGQFADKTVRRANEHFRSLGILTWISGNSASWRPDSRGQANQYRLVLSGINGCEVLGVTPAMLRSVRSQVREGKSANQPNSPNDS